MNNEIEKYMEKIRNVLDKTTDPFAIIHKKEILDIIQPIANKNWLADGDPTLTVDQINEAYSIVKNKTKDKSWQLLGQYNICMN